MLRRRTGRKGKLYSRQSRASSTSTEQPRNGQEDGKGRTQEEETGRRSLQRETSRGLSERGERPSEIRERDGSCLRPCTQEGLLLGGRRTGEREVDGGGCNWPLTGERARPAKEQSRARGKGREEESLLLLLRSVLLNGREGGRVGGREARRLVGVERCQSVKSKNAKTELAGTVLLPEDRDWGFVDEEQKRERVRRRERARQASKAGGSTFLAQRKRHVFFSFRLARDARVEGKQLPSACRAAGHSAEEYLPDVHLLNASKPLSQSIPRSTN